jgi:hypothetical protein
MSLLVAPSKNDITGRWVTKAHAAENPDTTVRHVIQPKQETACD